MWLGVLLVGCLTKDVAVQRIETRFRDLDASHAVRAPAVVTQLQRVVARIPDSACLEARALNQTQTREALALVEAGLARRRLRDRPAATGNNLLDRLTGVDHTAREIVERAIEDGIVSVLVSIASFTTYGVYAQSTGRTLDLDVLLRFFEAI